MMHLEAIKERNRTEPRSTLYGEGYALGRSGAPCSRNAGRWASDWYRGHEDGRRVYLSEEARRDWLRSRK